jgi:hypothetical protein
MALWGSLGNSTGAREWGARASFLGEAFAIRSSYNGTTTSVGLN